MKSEKIIGWLFISGAVGVFIPYTILTIIFDYPDILRQDAGIILTRFHEAGSSLIIVWFLFALLGIPLLPAYISLGKKLEDRFGYVRWATTLSVISGIVQVIGLLRWTFVVPVLAKAYLSGDASIKESVKIIFKTIHQFGGVLLGEHLGQFFTVIWTVVICYALQQAKFLPRWMSWLGFVASAIYFLAQAELLHTVIPAIPYWEPAGFIGSTLWLCWLIILGVQLLRKPMQ